MSQNLEKSFIAFYLIIALLQLVPFGSAQTPEYSVDYDKYILFNWKGALTSHSVNLKVFPRISQLNEDNYNTYLVYIYDNDGLNDTTVTPVTFEVEAEPIARIALTDLKPDTEYAYGFIFVSTASTLELADIKAAYIAAEPKQEFIFKTLGLALTPYSFKFGAASCANTGSNSSVFKTFHNEDIQFFILMGDLHYMNIEENDTSKFYEGYYSVFNSPNQKLFYQGVPVYYVWDDHDFGPNDNNGTSPSNYAANYVYRDFVPYGTLKGTLPEDDSALSAPAANRTEGLYKTQPDSDAQKGVFQSFIVGRCFFIILDLRSYRDIVEGDLLGEEQTVWLENQLRFAGYTTDIAQIFIVSSSPWIHTNKASDWSPYPSTQETIAGWIEEYIPTTKHIMMLSGDAHMIAFDDGSNNVYGGFPIVQAAALDRNGSCKGGPYSHGFFAGTGQYGILEVDDEDGKICVKVDLKRNGMNKSMIAYDTCHPEEHPKKQGSCPATNIVDPVEDTTTPPVDEGIWWVWVLIGIAVFVVVAYFGYMKYKKTHEPRPLIEDAERPDYIEMSQPKKRRGGDD